MIEYRSSASVEQAWLPGKRSVGKKKNPGLLLGNNFIKYSRKLETVTQFWTHSEV